MEKIVFAVVILAIVALVVYILIVKGILPSPTVLFDALRTCRICPSFQLPS